MTPRTEALVAAAWWASKLATAAEHEEVTSRSSVQVQLPNRSYTAVQVEAFRTALAERIEARLADHLHSWNPDDPLWGAAFRVICNGYGLHPVLLDAAEEAGIQVRLLDLPIETAMWVNPGHVTVGEGRGAAPVEIWRATA